MDKHGIKILRLILIFIWVTGCATAGDVLRMKEKGKGTTKVYPVNADQAWKIAEMVFHWRGMDTVEEHRAKGYMLTKSRESSISWATFAGVWIEPVDKDNTKVTVITKQKDPTEFLAAFTDTVFHEEFATEVEKVKRGKSLSLIPPVDNPQLVPPERPAAPAPAFSPPGAKRVIVTWTFANVRSGPGNQYPVVMPVKQGDQLTVIGEYEEWFNVKLQDGREGWIKMGVVK